MATFIEEKKVIENYVKNYVSETVDLAKYIEGSPSFVTYYSKDLRASMEDISLQNTEHIIGEKSSLRYNKVINFPIYNLEELSIDNDYDEELGKETRLEISATIIPGTLKPLEDDFFIIDYMDKEIIFRISKVEVGTINNKSYYKISAYRSGTAHDKDKLENQVTSKYQTVYDNVGNDKNGVVILKEEKFLKLEKLEKKLEETKRKFIREFYSKDVGTFLFRINEDEFIYDKFLIEFFRDNQFFVKNKTLMKNIVLEHLSKFSIEDDNIFEGTIFYAVLNRTTKYLKELAYGLESNRERFSILNTYKNKYEALLAVYYLKSDLDDKNNSYKELDKDFKFKYKYHPYPEDKVPFYYALFPDNVLLEGYIRSLEINNILNQSYDTIFYFNSLFYDSMISGVHLEGEDESVTLYNIINDYINNKDENLLIDDILNFNIHSLKTYDKFILCACYIFIINNLMISILKTNN